MSAIDLTTISAPLAALLASFMGATATVAASLINLRTAWKKEMKARERREPVTKKNRRGPVLAIVVLMIASAIGGFTLSQYLTSGRKEASAMDQDLRARLDELTAVVKRLEDSRPGIQQTAFQPQSGAPAHSEGMASTLVSLAPCTRHAGDGQESSCTDKEAVHVSLCAELPPGATILGVERFVREDGDTRPWTDIRLNPGQQPASGLFSGDPKERADAGTHQVCQEFQHWENRARMARIVVKYAMN